VVKALIVANGFLEAQVTKLQASVSGRLLARPVRSLARSRALRDERGHILRRASVVAADDGIAPGEPTECFNPNSAAMRAEVLSRNPGSLGPSPSAGHGIRRLATSVTQS
jgi:hypothetical protein